MSKAKELTLKALGMFVELCVIIVVEQEGLHYGNIRRKLKPLVYKR